MDISGMLVSYEQGDLTPKEIVALFKELIKTGLVWQLQGHYGRQAKYLIESGLLVDVPKPDYTGRKRRGGWAMSRLRGVLYTSRIVTMPKGSWKWQNAYAYARYAIKRTQRGKLVWFSFHRGVKRSLPQLRRAGYGDVPMGSVHHQPLDRDDLASLLRKARRVLGRKASRAYRLAKRLIPGLLEISNDARRVG